MVAARAPRRGKRSAAAVRTRLGVGRAVEQGEEVEDFLGLEAGAFDAQLVDGGLRYPGGRRNRCGWRRRAPPAAGARRARRYSMASPASARSCEQALAVGDAAGPSPVRACRAGWRRSGRRAAGAASNSRTSALVRLQEAKPWAVSFARPTSYFRAFAGRLFRSPPACPR